MTQNLDDKRCWHCWIYTADDVNPEFLYGYVTQSQIKADQAPPHSRMLDSDIKEHYLPLTTEHFEQLTADLDNGILDLNRKNIALIAPHPIKYKQTTIQNVMRTCTATIDTYYTLTIPNFEFTPQQIFTLFSHLQGTSPEIHPERFMQKVGSFDVITLPPHAELHVPILSIIFPHKEDISSPPVTINQFQIIRHQTIAEEQHYAHIKLFCGYNTLSENIYILPAGDRISKPVTVTNEFNKFEIRLFNDQGKLIHHEERTISSGSTITTTTTESLGPYHDRFGSKLLNTAGPQKAASLLQLRRTSKGSTSRTHYTTIGEIYNYQLEMLERGKRVFNSSFEDRWFPKSILGSADALPHLISLIDHHETASCWLVDPFFDILAFKTIIPRISRENIKLTVITNLNTINPSTGQQVFKCFIPIVQKFEDELNKQSSLIQCRFKLLNLLKTPTSSNQAFHDRYLCIKSQDGKFSIYLLSNSLNSFVSANYPFCMSKVSGNAAEMISNYILELSNKRDPITQNSLHCNLEWKNYA